MFGSFGGFVIFLVRVYVLFLVLLPEFLGKYF